MCELMPLSYVPFVFDGIVSLQIICNTMSLYKRRISGVLSCVSRFSTVYCRTISVTTVKRTEASSTSIKKGGRRGKRNFFKKKEIFILRNSATQRT